MPAVAAKLNRMVRLPASQWIGFVSAWLRRRRTGLMPCALPGARRLLLVPLRDYYEAYAFFAETPQGRRELGFFIDQLRPQDIVFDVGGFRGAYSSAVRTAFPDSSVHLFEPLAENFDRAVAIRDANALTRFVMTNKAVGAGTPELSAMRREDGMLCGLGRESPSATLQVPAISIDAYCHAADVQPTVLKIDVEGFEEEVIAGAKETLAGCQPRIWLELHPAALASRGLQWQEINATLEAAGYHVSRFADYDFPARDLGFHVWCEVPSA